MTFIGYFQSLEYSKVIERFGDLESDNITGGAPSLLESKKAGITFIAPVMYRLIIGELMISLSIVDFTCWYPP